MCTNTELKNKLALYANLASQIKNLDAQRKEVSEFILAEMEQRNTKELEGVKVITERLTETATKEGKNFIKQNVASEDIDKYITVSLSQFVNTRSLNKLI